MKTPLTLLLIAPWFCLLDTIPFRYRKKTKNVQNVCQKNIQNFFRYFSRFFGKLAKKTLKCKKVPIFKKI